MPKMKVMIASSEATPFIKTGGLADVVGALPIYLKNNGYLEVKAEDIEDAKRKHGITN